MFVLVFMWYIKLTGRSTARVVLVVVMNDDDDDDDDDDMFMTGYD